MLRSSTLMFSVASLAIALSACERTATLEDIRPANRPEQAALAVAPVTPMAAGETAASGTPATPTTTAKAATAATAATGGSCGGQCGGTSCGDKDGACGCNQIPNRAPRSVPDDATWTAFDVRGMRCGGCAKKIEAVVASVTGVYDVKADFRTGVVKVASDRNVRAEVGPQIAALGYKVQ